MQFIISSSYISSVNNNVSIWFGSTNFDRLRYVRRIAKSAANSMPTTEVVNLGQVFGEDKQTRKLAFGALAEQYRSTP